MTAPAPIASHGGSRPPFGAPTGVGRTANERRILILAPTANDAHLTAAFLTGSALLAQICIDAGDLVREIALGCGAIVLAEEVLRPAAVSQIIATLQTQPSWSDIPVTLVCSVQRERSSLRHLKLLGPTATVALIERPFRPDTLISMLEVALRSRERQYQVRDLVNEIAANETRVRRILEQSVVGIAETDLSGRFTLVNSRYCETVGRTREQLLQLKLPDITHPDDRDETRRRLAVLAAGTEASFIVEKRLVRPDGLVVWVHDHLSIIRSLDRNPIGMTVASADITSRKHNEEQLARARDEAVAASRAKDDFLASLSHELRTPLNPVLLLASDGASNPRLPVEVQADFETISRNVALEARLIDDLLDLTRITRGKLQLDRQVQPLLGILEDAIATVQPDVHDKRIRLEREFTSDPANVLADPVRLQQVLWNVLKNAVKFTPVGGVIHVNTRVLPGQRVAIAISDTGIGMTPEEISRIFDAFVQGNHATRGSHNFGGLGLGLAISKMLVDLHQGRISASSEGLGHGSTFTVELPLATEPVSARPRAPLPPDSSAGELLETLAGAQRILLVDDHEASRTALMYLLQRRHFRVTAAASVSDALLAAARGGVDLVVSDIGLPDGTGYDLMKKLSETYGLKGIAVTGYGMEQDVALSEEAGFVAHLTKPVKIQALDEALRFLLSTQPLGATLHRSSSHPPFLSGT